MTNVPHHLFVYGTLRRDALRTPEQQQPFEVLARNSQWLGEATVQAKLHQVGPYMAIVYPEHGQVRGEVYAIEPAQFDVVFARLDEYEGDDYQRQVVNAVLSNGEAIEAWAYTFHMPTEPELIRFCVDVFDAPPPTKLAERMALMKDETWGPGYKLRVRFLEGDAAVQEKVKTYAKQWGQHANINIVFVKEGDAEVRIAFRPGGSWSEVGKRARKVDAAKPTMNFGWLTPVTADDEYQRVVLHEFGHALGCIHEHQHPAGGIKWKKDAVYAYYKRTNGWDQARVDTNVFQAYSRTSSKAPARSMTNRS